MAGWRKGDIVLGFHLGIDSVETAIGFGPAPEVGFVELAGFLGLLTVEPFGLVSDIAGSFAAIA